MGIERKMQRLETFKDFPCGKFDDVLLENGHSSSQVVKPKYKRPKVFAARDFPPSCGRNASGFTLKSKEAIISVANENVEAAGRNEVKTPDKDFEDQAVKELQIHKEVVMPTNDSLSNPEAVLPSTIVGSHDQNAEPTTVDSSMILDNARLDIASGTLKNELSVSIEDSNRGICSSEDFGHEKSDFFKGPNKMNGSNPSSTELLIALDPKRSEFTTDTQNMNIAAPDEYAPPPSNFRLQSSPDIPTNQKSTFQNYPPRRSISAIRDFPPFCGRNAPCLTKEERLEALTSANEGKILHLGKSRSLKEKRPTDVKQKEGDIPDLQTPKGSNVQDNFNLSNNIQEINVQVPGDKVQVESVVTHIKETPKQSASGPVSSFASKVEKDNMVAKNIVASHTNNLNQSEHISKTFSGKGADEVKAMGRRLEKEIVVDHSEEDHIKEVRKQSRSVSATSSAVKLETDYVVSNTITSSHTNSTDRSDHKFQADSGNDVDEGRGVGRKLENELAVYDSEVANSEGKTGKGIVVYTKKKNEKRRSLMSPGGNQSDTEDLGFSFVEDRMIVQGLMAAPYCPWRQGRGAHNASGTKRKKYDIYGQNNSKFLPRKKVSVEKIDKSESMNDELSSLADVAYDGAGEEAYDGAGEEAYDGAGEEAYDGTGEELVMDEVNSNDLDEEHQQPDVNYKPSKLGVGPLRVVPISSCRKSEFSDAAVTRNKVRETLRLFQAVCRKLLQEEEAKSKEGERGSRRFDLQAAKILKKKGKYVNVGKQILGHVPGVEVGDEFHYRVELNIVGLHRHIQAGIDYLKRGRDIIATSIVASGGYADDLDNSDILKYTGSGGNVMAGDKAPEDQKLERGNLALKNCWNAKTPVRVIRGLKETKASESSDSRAKLVTTYTYDGLYRVENFWQEVGPHGKMVFQFLLRRIPGQPELAWNIVKKSKKLKVREGLCVNDISQGMEPFPICAINTIDDEKPPPFKYISSMIYPDCYLPVSSRGCECTKGCSDSGRCLCAVKNGGEIPYNHNGAIVEAKPLVYECSPSCKCPPSCHNRVSQHGIKFQLEVFKTESRGWGVRSLNSIPSGSFICEYLGELLEDKEAEQRNSNDEYLFDIGQNYNDHTLWDGLSNLMPDLQPTSCEVVEQVGFTIDAAHYGNIGRFINHSCSPNLYAQNVLYDHDDKRMPHIMLFAAENIPPLQELTYHYNYAMNQVRDSNGNIRQKDCYCGSAECTGRMY